MSDLVQELRRADLERCNKHPWLFDKMCKEAVERIDALEAMSNAFNTGERKMNIDNLTFGEMKQIAAMFNGAQPSQQAAATITPGDGRAVIVRSRDAGVLFGEFAGNDGSTIYLKNARQLWQWFAADGITLIDVSMHGVKADKCRFSTAQATMTIFNACALIDCTDEAAASIRKVC